MRTTLTLDPDVEKMISDEVHRVRKPFKQVVNDAIRRGLAPRLSEGPSKPYRVAAHRTKLAPGFDPGSFNRLADELEDEATVSKLRRSSRR